MSTPSPLPPPPQGALEEASSPKSRVRITVLTILALHVVVIGGLLLQGCDRRPATPAPATNAVASLPSLGDSTNYFTSFPGDSAAGAGTAVPSGAPGQSGAVDPGAAAVPGGAAPSVASSGYPGGTGAGSGSSAPAGGGLAPLASNPASVLSQAANPATSASGWTEHTIRKGETIGGLARKYGVTEKAIFEANPLVKPRSLKIDDRLVIPAPVVAAAAAAAPAGGIGGAHVAGAGEVYVVKQGDTLGRIAKKFGVSLKSLRGANNLKGDRILPKQKLTIPVKAVPTHVEPAAGTRPAGGQ